MPQAAFQYSKIPQHPLPCEQQALEMPGQRFSRTTSSLASRIQAGFYWLGSTSPSQTAGRKDGGYINFNELIPFCDPGAVEKPTSNPSP